MPEGTTVTEMRGPEINAAAGEGEGRRNRTATLHWLWGSVLIVLLDQSTKAAVEAGLRLYQTIELLPVFNLTLAHNSGAAFSLLASANGWQRWLFSILAVMVSGLLIVWLRRLRPDAVSEALGIALILGGAWGNLWDRIWLGYVIDFIQVHWHDWYFPAFNVADSAITIGAGLLILDAFFPQGGKRNS
ncbi:lipoprotein signal peptidase [Gammaproteobacteria bacterium]